MDQISMVKESLSQSMVADGGALLHKLDEAKWDASAAFWFYSPDTNGWQLFIASPEVGVKGPRDSYTTVQKALKELGPPASALSLDDIRLIPSNHALVGLLGPFMVTGQSMGSIRFSQVVMSGHFIDDAYIYRMNAPVAA